jgi:hypothetical protein
MSLRTFVFGAFFMCAALFAIIFTAPSFMKNEPQDPAKVERQAMMRKKMTPPPDTEVDENDAINEERTEAPSIDEQQEAENPFGEE